MPSLDVSGLTARLVRPGSLWRDVRVVDQTGSTNADLLAQARSGAPGGLILVAEEQTAGRGRLDRQWVSTREASLTFSVLLRPDGVAPASLGWLPLLAGVAVASAVTEAGVLARLKWPNDVLASRGKLAGILSEGAGGAVVVGAGINVGQRLADLPGTAATSVAAETGAPGSRDALLAAILAEFERWYLAWVGSPDPGDAGACGLRLEYLRWCATVGQDVRVMLPGGDLMTGKATGIDPAGRLEVATETGTVPVSAGDVVHVR